MNVTAPHPVSFLRPWNASSTLLCPLPQPAWSHAESTPRPLSRALQGWTQVSGDTQLCNRCDSVFGDLQNRSDG